GSANNLIGLKPRRFPILRELLFFGCIRRRVRSLSGAQDIDHSDSFGRADDCQVEIVDFFATLAGFHEQIAHAFVDDRLDEYVILGALYDEAAAARSGVVKISANYFLDRLRKRNSS